jgi:hypothetical protein
MTNFAGASAAGLTPILGAVEDFINAHEKVFIVLATVAIAVFTYTLWRATDKLWEAGEVARTTAKESADATLAHLEKSSKQELRAYIGVAAKALGRFPVPREVPQFGVTIENFGKTPAYEVSARIGWHVTNYPHSDGYAFPVPTGERAETAFVIDPGDARDVNSEPGQTVDEAMAAAIGSGRTPSVEGEVALCVSGIVTFTDAFGHSHSRPFCTFYRAPNGAKAYCLLHNNAD